MTEYDARVVVWMPRALADLALIRANGTGISRSEYMRRLLMDDLESETE